MEIFGYVGIIVIFLSVFLPVVTGIVHYHRENKKLDQEARRPAGRD